MGQQNDQPQSLQDLSSSGTYLLSFIFLQILTMYFMDMGACLVSIPHIFFLNEFQPCFALYLSSLEDTRLREISPTLSSWGALICLYFLPRSSRKSKGPDVTNETQELVFF